MILEGSTYNGKKDGRWFKPLGHMLQAQEIMCQANEYYQQILCMAFLSSKDISWMINSNNDWDCWRNISCAIPPVWPVLYPPQDPSRSLLKGCLLIFLHNLELYLLSTLLSRSMDYWSRMGRVLCSIITVWFVIYKKYCTTLPVTYVWCCGPQGRRYMLTE